jgi:hypothetical protein
MKQAVIKWLKAGVFVVLAFLLFSFGAWPKNREPAPSLSLASAWFCEKFANGVGIDVQRDGLKIAAVNEKYAHYRIDFTVNGAWQIKATLYAGMMLICLLMFSGPFPVSRIARALLMIVVFHFVRLMVLASASIVATVASVDSVTRIGYMICTVLAMLASLNLSILPEFRKRPIEPLVPDAAVLKC